MCYSDNLRSFDESSIMPIEEFEKIASEAFAESKNFEEFKNIMVEEVNGLSEQEVLEEYEINRKEVGLC